MGEEQKAKVSIANRGRVAWNKGGTVSLEIRARISATERGKVLSLATREKMSVTRKGSKISPEVSAKRWKGGSTIWRRKSQAKRRALGFAPLNAPFAGGVGHHVDNEQVINMPEALHRSIYHNQNTGQGMAKINAIAYNFLFKQEVESVLGVSK
jgi:hypothetical protein